MAKLTQKKGAVLLHVSSNMTFMFLQYISCHSLTCQTVSLSNVSATADKSNYNPVSHIVKLKLSVASVSSFSL